MKKSFSYFKVLTESWYYPRWWNYLLYPLSILFYGIVVLRKNFYRLGLFKKYRFDRPIIVVGNLTVGGTGKTPLVIFLAEQLSQRGFHPVIISRGYGRKKNKLKLVTLDSAPTEVGDEPLLIFKKTGIPVIVSTKRVKAVELAKAQFKCDVIISDDGLQHYALERDIEIAVVDGSCRFGSEWLLPAGPLREPLSRLKKVDFIVNNGDIRKNEIPMKCALHEAVHLSTGQTFSLASFKGKTVHAVAGLGHPKRFFNSLIAKGIKIIPHAYPDHYLFSADDLTFSDPFPILMTEKDSVRCSDFIDEKMYHVTITTQLPENFIQLILNKLSRLKGGS